MAKYCNAKFTRVSDGNQLRIYWKSSVHSHDIDTAKSTEIVNALYRFTHEDWEYGHSFQAGGNHPGTYDISKILVYGEDFG